MTVHDQSAQPEVVARMPRATPRWVWFAVATLLATYAALAIGGSRAKGLSFDEGLQLAAGYNLWLHGDHRIEGANGDLIRRWATLPYLFSRPKFVGRDDPVWQSGDGYNLGRRFLFELGNHPPVLLLQARMMVALLGVILGLLVFLCARHLFGPAGGLVSLALFVFSPHMLAFGGIVSTDLSITLTLFAATWWIWRLLHEVTWLRLAGSLGWTGLLVLAKPTALVILPVAALLVLIRFQRGGPLVLRWRNSALALTCRRRQAMVVAVLIVLHGFAGWAALWAHYGFRYRASPEPHNAAVVFAELPVRDHIPAPVAAMLAWLEQGQVVPEGYLHGITKLLSSDDTLAAFVNNRWRLGGWWWFFPYAIWVKTHPALFALVVLGLVAWWLAGRRAKAGAASSQRSPPRWYEATPLFTLVGCFLVVAMTEDINIGHRHVLPIYPPLEVLGGAVMLAGGRGAVWMRSTLVGLLGWFAADSVTQRSNFLAYFGPQAGGSEEGYRHLVDSSLDWGMNLPALKRWIDTHNRHGREPVFLAYFGTDNPRYYGIRATRLPSFFERRKFEPYVLTPGYYAISATLFQSVYTTAFGPWNREYEELYRGMIRRFEVFQQKVPEPARWLEYVRQSNDLTLLNQYELLDHLRFARLCAWLRQQGPPPHQVENAIFIWRLDEADLQAALLGPPVELADFDGIIRPHRHFIPLGQ